MQLTVEREIEVKDMRINGHRIKVAIRPGLNKQLTPLLVFNGIGANWEVIISAFKTLNRDIEIITFDTPGTGSSSTPILPYSMKSLARIAKKMLVKLNYEYVNILGISWGGGLAQQFAYMFPNYCKKLILVATSAGPLMIPARPSVLVKMATPMRYWSPRYMKSIAGSIYGGKFRNNKKLVAEFSKKIKPNNAWGYVLQLSVIPRFTSLFWLKKIKQPTLVLAGDDDPIIPLINSRILASKIPNASLSVIKKGGHLFLFAQPEKAFPQIEKFLNESQ